MKGELVSDKDSISQRISRMKLATPVVSIGEDATGVQYVKLANGSTLFLEPIRHPGNNEKSYEYNLYHKIPGALSDKGVLKLNKAFEEDILWWVLENI